MPAYPTSGYMTAELCLNGHVITGDTENEPEKTSKFCGECGAETIRSCPKCGASLRGDHVYMGHITWMTPPQYCYSCGAGFPWTVAKIAAAKEHAGEIEGLDEAERKQLQEVIDDLAAGGARTDLAASHEESWRGGRQWALQGSRGRSLGCREEGADGLKRPAAAWHPHPDAAPSPARGRASDRGQVGSDGATDFASLEREGRPCSIGAVCPRREARGGGSRTPRFRDPRRSRHNLAPAVEATLPNRVATPGWPTAGDGLLGRDSRKPRPSPRNGAAG